MMPSTINVYAPAATDDPVSIADQALSRSFTLCSAQPRTRLSLSSIMMSTSHAFVAAEAVERATLWRPVRHTLLALDALDRRNQPPSSSPRTIDALRDFDRASL